MVFNDLIDIHKSGWWSGSAKTYANLTQVYVDVRDVAKAHILVYETPSASGQRYLCAECNLHRADLVHLLARECPRCSHPTKYVHTPNSHIKHISLWVLSNCVIFRNIEDKWSLQLHARRCSDEKNPRKQPYKFSNEKLKDLGLSFTPMNQCLADAVASLHNRGFLEH